MINIDWLLGSLGIQSSIFHAGKYCGSWQSSTSGLAKASFHIVVEGGCWLHLEDGLPSQRLMRGDALFMLHDVPFILSSSESRDEALQTQRIAMQPMSHSLLNSTGLICGFLTFSSLMTPVILAMLPKWIVLRSQSKEVNNVRMIIELLYEEAHNRTHPSQRFLSSMAEALLFIALRQYIESTPLPETLSAINNTPEFLPLIAEIIHNPAREWTLPAMAEVMQMSRAHFSKCFTVISGHSPGQALRILRMSLACQKLQQGNSSLPQVAEEVGYQSLSAFSRAFQRTIGQLPGEYRKSQLRMDQDETTDSSVI